MKLIDRRSFLVAGAGGLGTSAAALAQSGTGRIYQPGVPSTFAFLVQPGMTSRYEPTKQQSSQAIPWAFFPASGTDIANLFPPQFYNVEQLEAWAEQKRGNCCTAGSNSMVASSDPIDVVTTLPFIGTPATSDIEAAVVGNLADGVAVDLSLDFLSPATDGQAQGYSFSNINGVPVFEATPFSTQPQLRPESVLQPNTNVSPPPSVELFGWRLQFRGPETHPLGSCVSAPVTHFNVELFQAIGGGRYQYAANFHLGTYRSAGSRCFVLFNNIRPVVCWKTCSPTMGDLAGMFRWMLAAAAALLAVAIAAWIIAAIAEAAASVAFAALLLLA